MRISKDKLIFFTLLLFICMQLFGCAGVPLRDDFSVYCINGTEYIALIKFCEQKDLTWEYDPFTRRITLGDSAHKVNMRIGESLATVDGDSRSMEDPVISDRGRVLIPDSFRRETLDVLFTRKISRLQKRSRLAKIGVNKIVIDPGHGGKDPGAIGRSGLKEKDVNLDISKKLAALLRSEGVEVVMTRNSDVFVSLSGRAKIANRERPDLFISVHANANHSRRVQGFEVYCITSTPAKDSKRVRASASSLPPDIDKSSIVNSSNLRRVLWDMVHTSNRADSVELSDLVCESMGRASSIKISGTKYANFYVLKKTQMPAILVEAGYLSNRQEEQFLKTSQYRQQVAGAIVQGIKQYAQDCLLVRAE